MKRKEKRVNAFKSMHPVTNLIFFVAEFIVIMFVANPILQGIALVSGFFYACALTGRKALKLGLFCIPVILLAAIINPLFSHEGATILTYYKNDNPLTLESIYYGIGMGIMVSACIIWFYVLNEIMTTDKWIHIFGKIIPSLGLLLSMIMRFIPKLIKQRRQMKLVNRKANQFTLFSMLVTWGLETSVDTADSMAARGYGLGERTSYSIFHLKRSDICFILLSIALAVFVIGQVLCENMIFYYYPLLIIKGEMPFLILGYFMYGFLSLMPLLFEWKENIKWNYLKSKI